jgi:DNA-binding transcriptional LysR family regulator
VALRIEVEGADRLIDRVRSRELDAAIVQIEPYFAKEGLTQIVLFEDKRAYYVGTRHPLARKKAVGRSDIERASHVTVGAFYERRATSLAASAAGAGRGLQIELSGDVSIALHLLSTGIYVAALPEFVMQHLCDARQFVRLPFRGAMPSRTLSVWHREDMGGQPLIKEFCRRFTGYLASLRTKDEGLAKEHRIARPSGTKHRSGRY